MPLSFIFWLFYILLAIGGGWWAFRTVENRVYFGPHVLLLIVLFILGWRVFGFVVQGG
jgi:hypothetical protein